MWGVCVDAEVCRAAIRLIYLMLLVKVLCLSICVCVVPLADEPVLVQWQDGNSVSWGSHTWSWRGRQVKQENPNKTYFCSTRCSYNFCFTSCELLWKFPTWSLKKKFGNLHWPERFRVKLLCLHFLLEPACRAAPVHSGLLSDPVGVETGLSLGLIDSHHSTLVQKQLQKEVLSVSEGPNICLTSFTHKNMKSPQSIRLQPEIFKLNF